MWIVLGTCEQCVNSDFCLLYNELMWYYCSRTGERLKKKKARKCKLVNAGTNPNNTNVLNLNWAFVKNLYEELLLWNIILGFKNALLGSQNAYSNRPNGSETIGVEKITQLYIYIILFFGEAPRVILFKTNNNQK